MNRSGQWPIYDFRVLRSPYQAGSDLMNPAWSGDPIPGLARAYPARSGLREFADDPHQVIVSDEHVVHLRRLTSNRSDRENSMNFLDHL